MSTPANRDRDVRRVRAAAWTVSLTAATLAGGLSVAAAHAFKGHDGRPRAAPPVRVARAIRVPPAQRVPAIAGEAQPLQPPAAPPTAAPPTAAPPTAAPAQPVPQPETSGGS